MIRSTLNTVIKGNLTLLDIRPLYRVRVVLWRPWHVEHWNIIEKSERVWAFIRRQCLIGAASWCLGNSYSFTERQTSDERCEGKERRAVAGSRCGNKIVLLQGVCVLMTWGQKTQVPGGWQDVSLLEGEDDFWANFLEHLGVCGRRASFHLFQEKEALSVSLFTTVTWTFCTAPAYTLAER